MAIQALHDQGILLVASSGNGAQQGNFVEYPASYDHVMSVGAVDESGRVAPFSTFNAQVDISGPGVDVLSLGASSNNDYFSMSGTSMAAPHVAGVAALLWSQFPNKTATEIDQALTASARDVGSCGKDPVYGHGLVDAVAAAMYLESGVTASEKGNCVSVKVSLTTNISLESTTFQVTPENEPDHIVYRGGPYASVSVQDTFTLTGGCYHFQRFESSFDGRKGSVTLDYGATPQLSFVGLTGYQKKFRFGDCAPTAAPTAAPAAAPTAAPSAQPTVQSCIEDCVSIKVALTTDSYPMDTTYRVSESESGIIVYRRRPYEKASTTYEDTFNVTDGCYRFDWFDSFGDGSEGNVTLDYGVTRQLNLGAWYGYNQTFRFGNCAPSATPSAVSSAQPSTSTVPSSSSAPSVTPSAVPSLSKYPSAVPSAVPSAPPSPCEKMLVNEQRILTNEVSHLGAVPLAHKAAQQEIIITYQQEVVIEVQQLCYVEKELVKAEAKLPTVTGENAPNEQANIVTVATEAFQSQTLVIPLRKKVVASAKSLFLDPMNTNLVQNLRGAIAAANQQDFKAEKDIATLVRLLSK
jgi:Subtilase family